MANSRASKRAKAQKDKELEQELAHITGVSLASLRGVELSAEIFREFLNYVKISNKINQPKYMSILGLFFRHSKQYKNLKESQKLSYERLLNFQNYYLLASVNFAEQSKNDDDETVKITLAVAATKLNDIALFINPELTNESNK